MKQGSVEIPFFEWIRDDEGNTLAMILPKEYNPAKTQFLTPDEYTQQLGFIVYHKGGTVDTHMHVPLDCHFTGTLKVKR